MQNNILELIGFDDGKTTLRLGDVFRGCASWRVFPPIEHEERIVQMARWSDPEAGKSYTRNGPPPPRTIDYTPSMNRIEAEFKDQFFMAVRKEPDQFIYENTTKITAVQTNESGDILTEGGLVITFVLNNNPARPPFETNTIQHSWLDRYNNRAGAYYVLPETPKIVGHREIGFMDFVPIVL